MRAYIVQNWAIALFVLGLAFFYAGPAQAMPIGGHPDKCQGPYPSRGPACEASGGHVWCTNDGDYMCCFVDSNTGAMNCTQLEEMRRPIQGLRPSSGGVMRRGVEGEQAETNTGDSSTPASESK